MREQSFLLLLGLSGALGLLNDGGPVVFGENRHEPQSELPHAQTRCLRIAVRVHGLEEHLQSVAVQRFHVVQERRIENYIYYGESGLATR